VAKTLQEGSNLKEEVSMMQTTIPDPPVSDGQYCEYGE